MFRHANETWYIAEMIFVDRDFTQKAVLEAIFPKVPIPICAFQVMKTLKLHVSREKLHVKEKQELLS